MRTPDYWYVGGDGEFTFQNQSETMSKKEGENSSCARLHNDELRWWML